MALNTPVDHCPDGVPQDWQPTAVGPSGAALGHLTCAVSLGSRSDTEVVRWAAPAAVPATIGGAPVMSGDAHGIAVNTAGAALVVSERWFAEPSLVTYVVGGGAQQRELMLDATTPVEGSDLADDGTVVGSVVTWDELGPAQRPVIASATASRPTLLPWPADQPLSYGTQNAPPLLISPDARLIVRNVAGGAGAAGGAGGAGGVLAWDAKRRPTILRGSEGFTAYDVNARHEILGGTQLGPAIWRNGTVRQIDVRGLPAGAAIQWALRFNARGEIGALLQLSDGSKRPVLLVPAR